MASKSGADVAEKATAGPQPSALGLAERPEAGETNQGNAHAVEGGHRHVHHGNRHHHGSRHRHGRHHAHHRRKEHGDSNIGDATGRPHAGPEIVDDDACLQEELETEASSSKALQAKGSLEQVPVSAPSTEEAMLVSTAYDDSIDLAALKAPKEKTTNARQDSIDEPSEHGSDRQPQKHLPSVRRPHERYQGENRPSASGQPALSTWNDRGEILVPEATLVTEEQEIGDEDIPSATVVRPEKYSLTIAGRKIPLYLLVIGAVVVLGVVIALSLTLPPDDGGDESKESIVVRTATSAPSVSLFPSLSPSVEPSTSPTTVLQAEVMEIITNYSGGVISDSFADAQSNHRKALQWLVDDLSGQASDHESTFSDAEIVERFVLALIYFETDGDDWLNSFDFLSNENVCKWRGSLQRTYRKGVTRCTDDMRVTNLTLFGNNLQGSLPTEIGLLKGLSALHLRFNDIEGSLPDTLGSLENMTHIELNSNDLEGNIEALSRLSNLQVVELSSNELTGSLGSAGNLTKLESFKVAGNKLTGSVPRSFKDFSELEVLHLHSNQLTGSIDFMCGDLPSDYQLDCYGDEPEVRCNCCLGCTIVNDEECDPNTQRPILLDIDSGSHGSFQWELYDDGALTAAGGYYEDDEAISVQLCISFPGHHLITTNTDLGSDAESGARVTFSIGDYTSSIGPDDYAYFALTSEGDIIGASDGKIPTPHPSTSTKPSGLPSSSLLPSGTVLPSWSPSSSLFPTSTSPPTPRPTTYWAEMAPPGPIYRCYGLAFTLNLTTDAFGMDTRWEVFEKTNGTLVASKSSFASNRTFQFSECLDWAGCYDFIIRDVWDDGICCQQGEGSYSVSISDREVGRGGKFGSSETVAIGGNCGVDPTYEGTCPDNYSLVNVTINTDRRAVDTDWEVFDPSTGQIYMTNEHALEDDASMSWIKCVPTKDCYQFTVYDSRGYGGPEWTVEYEDAHVGRGDGDFLWTDSTTFGYHC